MSLPASSPFLPMFEAFRAELDEHHDRRERTIKASRDITALSKKTIFSLQRVRTLPGPIPPLILKENVGRARQIESLLVSTTTPTTGASTLNAHRYHRQLSPGLQELVEAAVFAHYLATQTLLAPDAVLAAALAGATASPPPSSALLPLEADDYLLGVYDAVGEMMRFAITGMAVGGGRVPGGSGGGRDVVGDLRALRSALEGLRVGGEEEGRLGREVAKKGEVMRACVEKVERAVYGLVVRGGERPAGWVPGSEGEAD